MKHTLYEAQVEHEAQVSGVLMTTLQLSQPSAGRWSGQKPSNHSNHLQCSTLYGAAAVIG